MKKVRAKRKRLWGDSVAEIVECKREVLESVNTTKTRGELTVEIIVGEVD